MNPQPRHHRLEGFRSGCIHAVLITSIARSNRSRHARSKLGDKWSSGTRSYPLAHIPYMLVSYEQYPRRVCVTDARRETLAP